MPGVWQLDHFECAGQSLLPTLTQRQQQVTQGYSTYWLSIDSQGNVQGRMTSPFQWQTGGCLETFTESWATTENGNVAVTATEGKGKIYENSKPSGAQKTACASSLTKKELRNYMLATGQGTFSLTSAGPFESGGYCENGNLTWVFVPLSTPPSQWANVAPKPAPFTPISPSLLQSQMRAALAVYSDSYGMTTPNPGQTTGNGLLYSAETLLMLKSQGFLNSGDKTWYQNIVQSCFLQPGLLKRNPANTYGQEGPDDYVGVGAGASIAQPSLASSILTYGETKPAVLNIKDIENAKPQLTNFEKDLLSAVKFGIPVKYVYNNVNPQTFLNEEGKFTLAPWIGRQLNLLAHLQFSAKQQPSPERMLVWLGALGQSMMSSPRNQDGWILGWLLTVSASNMPSLGADAKDAIKLWTDFFSKSFPGGQNQLFRSYFNNTEMPLSKYFPGEDAFVPML